MLTTIQTLVFTLKCLKKYFPNLLSDSVDIFTVSFSSFISISKCFSVFYQSTNTSKSDESCNQDDTFISDHNRLQPLVISASHECFSRTNTI